MNASPQSPSRMAWLDQAIGVLRSLIIYRRPGRQRGLQRMYASFVQPGDLVFDIGAHVGDRTLAFAALGARVVALEPQPQLLPWLRRAVRGRPGIAIRREVAGPRPGSAQLQISRRHPTVSSASRPWVRSLRNHNRSFQHVHWDDEITVPMVTLDQLIEEYGTPAFCKIDVEGLEAEVLRGLTHAVPALSFEFVAGALDVTRDCLRQLDALDTYEYNLIPGEQRQYRFAQWQSGAEILTWLEAHGDRLGSGDLYARRPVA
ncbi:FkbM family methyltransferase [Thioalkalivibrio sp. ALE17]|uniref:FkbM family methyltransferase n=1 Tax=Thioalkalivibrio sp. ALE17 TaxID=1158173 RepID=UPI00048F9C50|nr:FkbM family methyltransferase [Thioalkalivibrio sp. ALE17]